jgi:hypothetical protein
MFEPVHKRSLVHSNTRAINVGNNLGRVIKIEVKLDGKRKLVLENKGTTQTITSPNSDKTPRGTKRREVLKMIKGGRAKTSNELIVKEVMLSFFETKNITTRFRDFITNRIPFFLLINPTDVPA